MDYDSVLTTWMLCSAFTTVMAVVVIATLRPKPRHILLLAIICLAADAFVAFL